VPGLNLELKSFLLLMLLLLLFYVSLEGDYLAELLIIPKTLAVAQVPDHDFHEKDETKDVFHYIKNHLMGFIVIHIRVYPDPDLVSNYNCKLELFKLRGASNYSENVPLLGLDTEISLHPLPVLQVIPMLP